MKRLSKETEEQKHTSYWQHSAARHMQELERSEERRQQAELAGSMRAEAINNAPIDELRKDIDDREKIQDKLYLACELISEVLHELEK
jgi:hypothetical protein